MQWSSYTTRLDLTGRNTGWTRDTFDPKTLIDYKRIVRNHLLPHFGEAPINSIDRQAVSKFLGSLARKGVAEGTIANIRQTLSMVLIKAARSGAILRNPADGV